VGCGGEDFVVPAVDDDGTVGVEGVEEGGDHLLDASPAQPCTGILPGDVEEAGVGDRRGQGRDPDSGTAGLGPQCLRQGQDEGLGCSVGGEAGCGQVRAMLAMLTTAPERRSIMAGRKRAVRSVDVVQFRVIMALNRRCAP
jgi:hypothetical protein